MSLVVAFLRQTLTVLPILLLSFLYGCKVGYTQAATPIFNSTQAPFNVTETDISWMGSISYTGTIVSVMICFFLGDKIGRKWFICGSVIAYILIWVTFLVTSDSILIIAGIAVYGISASMHAIMGSVYIGEVSSPSNREVFGIGYTLSMLLGIGIEFLISLADSYRLLICFPLVIAVLALLILFFMKESPYYLLGKGKNDEALTVEAWLMDQSEKDTQDELDKMITYSQSSQDAPKGRFSDMFKPENLKILGLMIFLNGSCSVNSGNVAQQYGQKVMEDFSKFMNLSIFVTIFNVISIVGAIVSLFTVKLLGRRLLLLGGFFLLFLSQVIIGVSYIIERQNDNDIEELAYVIASLHCITFFISMASCGAGLSILKTEIFPAKLKEFFSALLAFTGDLIGFGIVKTYVLLADSIGTEYVLIIYAVVNLLSAVLVLICVQDTKNKSLYDIQSDYKGDKKE